MIPFELAPAMPTTGAPDWPGARWIGAVDLAELPDGPLRIANDQGYGRARLLVRDGWRVRGFVDVPIAGDRIDIADILRESAGFSDSPALALRGAPPAFTVVICTRDRAELLRDALTAVLALDYRNFTVVVVDNAPATDATRTLVEREFSDRRISYVLEPVAGLSRARNTGLRAAQGDIVAFTDDDVIVDRAWLHELAAGFHRAPQVDLVCGLVPSGELRTRVQGYFDDRVSWSKNLAPRVFSLADPPADSPLFPFAVGDFGTGANFAIRRATALMLGGFDTALGVGTRTGGGEDIDMFTRILLAGRTLVMQPSALVWHRHRDDLPALRTQASGYGTGLGAWMTKILLDPRTARMAAARAVRASRRLLSLGSRSASVAPVTAADRSFERQLRAVARLELVSVARGPLTFARERRAGARVPRTMASEYEQRHRAGSAA